MSDNDEEYEEKEGVDLTDLTAFNKAYGRQRISQIGVRSTKSSAERTEEIIRKIMLSTTREEDLAAIDKETVRLSNLYGCGRKAVKRVSKAVDRRHRSNSDLYRYNESDWASVEKKLWNCNYFKDHGVSWMSEYQHATIDLPTLHNLMDISLQMKFTTREIAALVTHLGCTETVHGDITIDFNRLLKELKLLGNTIRSTDHLQVRKEHEHGLQARRHRTKQSHLHSPRGTGSNVDPVDLDPVCLYNSLRAVSAACQVQWKRENKYLLNLMHEIPTGTLDASSLREFLSYNLNTKLTVDDCFMLIQYYNCVMGRLAFTISMEDLTKEIKKLALEKYSVLSAPTNEAYSTWTESVHALNQQVVADRRDLRIAKKSTDNTEHACPTDDDISHDDASSISSLGNSVNSTTNTAAFHANEAHKKRIMAAMRHTDASSKHKVATIVRRQSSIPGGAGGSVHSPGGTSSSTTVTGTIKSIKYNAASPQVFSIQAAHEKSNKDDAVSHTVLSGGNGSEHRRQSVTVGHVESRVTLPVTGGGTSISSVSAPMEPSASASSDEKLGFLSAVKVLQKVRQVRVALAGGQELYEDDRKQKKRKECELEAKKKSDTAQSSQRDSSPHKDLLSNLRNMAVLPTAQGSKGPASLKGCGSSISRAKTPLYLIRPTNAADSLLGLAAQSRLLGRRSADDMPLSIFGPSDSDRSISSQVSSAMRPQADDNSVRSLSPEGSGKGGSDKSSVQRSVRHRRERAGQYAKDKMFARLDIAPLDEKAVGLRFTLRYKQIGEFVRCFKLQSKLTMEDVLRALWAAVQTQVGRGIDIVSESGVLIDRTNFTTVVQQLVPCMSSSDIQLLYSSLDPSRKGLVPCHLFYGFAKVAMLKPGCETGLVVKEMLHGAAWEQLNSRDCSDPSIVSALSTSNNDFYEQRRKERLLKDDMRQHGHNDKHFESREALQEQQRMEIRLAMEAAQRAKMQKEAEDLVVSRTYIPSAVVSNCLRALCTSLESEQNLHVYTEGLFKASYHRNLRQLDMLNESDAPQGASNSSSRYAVNSATAAKATASRPKRIDYVMVGSVLDFVEEPDIKRMLLFEHRRAIKAMGPYMHKNKGRESL